VIKADSYKFLLRKSDNMIVVLGSDNSILSMYKNTEECYFNSLTEDQIDYILNKLMSKMHNTIKRVRDSAISEDIETYLDSDKKIHYQIRIHYDGQVVMVIRRNTQIENEIEEFFELSPHILIILNREAEVINANRSFVELFGLDIDKIKGSRITDFFNGEELSEIMQISDMFLETNEAVDVKLVVAF
jgi:PAS domain-containing protein